MITCNIFSYSICTTFFPSPIKNTVLIKLQERLIQGKETVLFGGPSCNPWDLQILCKKEAEAEPWAK